MLLCDDKKDSASVTVSFSKYLDDASTALMQAYSNGDTIKSAIFEVVKRGDDGKVTVAHTIEYANGVISGLEAGSEHDLTSEMYTVEFGS